MRHPNLIKPALAIATTTLLIATLSGCGAVGRLKAVGKAPVFTAALPVDSPPIEDSL